MVQEAEAGQAWHEIVRDTLKANSVRLVTYVPDNVLKPLINALHADSYFTTFVTTREEEAVGIVTGAWMGGLRGIVLMQTSGFATLANVLASLPVAFQIPPPVPVYAAFPDTEESRRLTEPEFQIPPPDSPASLSTSREPSRVRAPDSSTRRENS